MCGGAKGVDGRGSGGLHQWDGSADEAACEGYREAFGERGPVEVYGAGAEGGVEVVDGRRDVADEDFGERPAPDHTDDAACDREEECFEEVQASELGARSTKAPEDSEAGQALLDGN